jgi:uncharacterized membrane protein YccC
MRVFLHLQGGSSMDGALWSLVTVVGPIVLGLVIAYLLIATWRRRNDPAAQAQSDRATDQLYKDEDKRDI